MMQSLEATCDKGETEVCPSRLKIAHNETIYKKRGHDILRNFRPVSQLSNRVVKKLKAFQRNVAQPLSSPKEEPEASCSSDFEENQFNKFDIFEELEKLYDEDEKDSNSSDNEEEGVQYKTLILEKLVARKNLNTVIFNLYPGNKGYSVVFRSGDRTIMSPKDGMEEMFETKTRLYEDDDLLRYLDNEELPPYILDGLSQYEYLFYSNCIIAEVRDYRQAYPNTTCSVHHILLRPTQKSLLADINNLTKDRSDLTPEDKDYIESQLVMAQNPALCLDPDPHIENKMAEIYNRKHLWNTHQFRRIARKFSQVTVNRKRKLDHLTHRHGLELFEFIKAKRSRPQNVVTGQSSRTLLKRAVPEENKTVIPIPNLECPTIMPPSHPVIINEFKAMSWPEETSDCSPQLMEEYILETDMPSKDKDTPRVYHIKLSIFQRPSNLEFLGELYLDRDHKKDERNGVACRFSLGSRPNAHRYVRQFTDIFTESGRKAARIKCGLSGTARNEAQGVPRGAQQQPNPREHLDKLTQSLQVQTPQSQPVLNGMVQAAQPVQLQQPVIQAANVQKTQQMSNQELEINALATQLMNSAQQFQAAENAKQQSVQQQKFLSNTNIINLLNSSPASNVNSDASAAVANAINSGVVPQQRLLARKMTLSNMAGGARVLNHSNLITLNNNRVNLQELNAHLNQTTPQTVTLTTCVNNNRVNLSELNTQLTAQQPQTVTLTSVNSGTYNYTTMPVKQQVVHQRIVNSSPSTDGSTKSSAFAALLVGTPAADRPDIVSPNANSLLLEKLAGGSGQNPFSQSSKPQQAQFVVQSPKGNTVISPMSSPPPQASSTLNLQGLNLAQLQSIPGLQNVQVQLQGFAQPISLALNVGGQFSGGTGGPGLLVSLPAGVATQTQSVVTQGTQQAVQGVVLNAAGPSQLAHLVSSGNMKNITHQNLRTASTAQLQRPSRQQAIPTQNALTSRTLQRTPITIKMAPNSNQATIETVQHYQQLCLNQQKGLDGVFDKLRRSSSEQPP